MRPDYRLGSVVLAATPGHQGVFDVLVGLHVLCALVGFGSVAISGVYGAWMRRTEEADDSEETARYFQSRGWPELLVLAVPVFGVAAIGFRPDGADFGDLWVIGGLVVVGPRRRSSVGSGPPGGEPDPRRQVGPQRSQLGSSLDVGGCRLRRPLCARPGSHGHATSMTGRTMPRRYGCFHPDHHGNRGSGPRGKTGQPSWRELSWPTR